MASCSQRVAFREEDLLTATTSARPILRARCCAHLLFQPRHNKINGITPAQQQRVIFSFYKANTKLAPCQCPVWLTSRAQGPPHVTLKKVAFERPDFEYDLRAGGKHARYCGGVDVLWRMILKWQLAGREQNERDAR